MKMRVDYSRPTLETYTAIAASSSFSNFVIVEGATLSLHRTDAPDQEKDEEEDEEKEEKEEGEEKEKDELEDD